MLEATLDKTTAACGARNTAGCPSSGAALCVFLREVQAYLDVGEEGLYGRQAVWEEERRGEARRKSLSGQ